jgi:lincosamide and streptogramin A transport system ATP-binding/permease protein
MPVITLSRLTFGYEGEDDLFANVSLQLETDWKLGLIGRNGRGKTTLLNLLLASQTQERSAQWEYYGTIHSPVPFEYFPYSVSDKTKSTYHIVTKIVPDFDNWQLERELSLLEVNLDVLDRPFETLSGGEQTKILLAALFLKSESRFLLIDEPTNHLDTEGRRKIGEYLNRKQGFILVSHDRLLLDSCIDHVLSINRSGIELLRGNFSVWQQNRENKDKFESATNERLHKQIKQLKKAARQTAVWSDKIEKEKYGSGPDGHGVPDTGFIGAKSARMMQRSKNIAARKQKAADEKTELFKDAEIDDPLILHPLKFHSRRLFDVTDLTIQYGEQPLFKPVSFSVNTGDRIALCGSNGCGKSSLLKLFQNGRSNNAIPFKGLCSIPSSLKISYVPQDTSFLTGTMQDFIEARQIDESLFKAVLYKFGFDKSRFDAVLDDYSAGQKKKLLLATSLCEEAHLYLWDEPLNYIDVLSRLQIEKMLQVSEVTLIFVEHDAVFLEAAATRQVVIST